MMEAVISIKLPNVWISNIMQRFDVEVRILDTIPFGESGVQDLVEIRLNEAKVEEIVTYLEGLDDIEDVQIESVESNRAIGAIKSKMCFACRDLIASECFLISAWTKGSERIEWKFITSDNECLQQLMANLVKHDAEPQIVKIKKIKEEEMLTENQEKIVRTAYERGYYDFPKRIGVKELAEMFEISTATLSEILRRGQRKIIQKFFEEK